MNVMFYSAREFERSVFERSNNGEHKFRFAEASLTLQTAKLAAGCEAICCFVNDTLDAQVLRQLQLQGVRLIALRSAGFNHLDVSALEDLGMTAVYTPAYSPHAIAEYAVGMLLSLVRRIPQANQRVSQLNFSLDDFVGFDLHGKTVGVFGTGRIGKVFCKIMRGFGCHVIANDAEPDFEWAEAHNVRYLGKAEVLAQSDVVSLHLPLNGSTSHFINATALNSMKREAIIINTSRGGIIDTAALLEALRTKVIGGACLDVYENERDIFFRTKSENGIRDKLLMRLIENPDVLLTGHQAFLTNEALQQIAATTMHSLTEFAGGNSLGDAKVPGSTPR